MPYYYFAENLRSLLSERGWKRADFAAAMGVSEMTVSLWLRGLNYPSHANIRKLEKLSGRRYSEMNSVPVYTEAPSTPNHVRDLSPDERLLINRYRALSDHGQFTVRTICLTEYNRGMYGINSCVPVNPKLNKISEPNEA